MLVCGFSDHPLSSVFENGAMVPMLGSSGIKTSLSSGNIPKSVVQQYHIYTPLKVWVKAGPGDLLLFIALICSKSSPTFESERV